MPEEQDSGLRVAKLFADARRHLRLEGHRHQQRADPQGQEGVERRESGAEGLHGE